MTISYLLVKNYDKNSVLVLDARQTQSFYVGKLKFNQTENLIFADRFGEIFLFCSENAVKQVLMSVCYLLSPPIEHCNRPYIPVQQPTQFNKPF